MAETSVAYPSKYIEDKTDPYLLLFPHRYDYIWAEHPHPGHAPNWQTESRHPLSDRLIQQGAFLYGIRFGSFTQYGLIDIDAGSIYHPQRDPLAYRRIVAVLEPLGLTRYLICTSSYSGGLHIYLPFPTPQKTWEIAIALQSLIENAGFKVAQGQLELFPNPKPYSVSGTPSLYKAHRLPMQAGSYLLDENLNLMWSDTELFAQQWLRVQVGNDLDDRKLKQILRQAHRHQFRLSAKADKFLNDLNAEIEAGWSGSGQTNRLLGRIALRSYIFGHLLSGSEPLEGRVLATEIARVAQALPGYREFCNHQHEIEKRAADWAACVERSHYFAYGTPPKGKYQPKQAALTQDTEPTWNVQQSQNARARISQGIAQLIETNSLPAKATERFKVLTSFGIGGATLYRHRDLWHPAHLWKTPPEPPPTSVLEPAGTEEAVPAAQTTKSLLLGNGGNMARDAELGTIDTPDRPSAGSNPQAVHQLLQRIKPQRASEELMSKPLSVNLDLEKAKLPGQVEGLARFLGSTDLVLVREGLSRLGGQVEEDGTGGDAEAVLRAIATGLAALGDRPVESMLQALVRQRVRERLSLVELRRWWGWMRQVAGGRPWAGSRPRSG